MQLENKSKLQKSRLKRGQRLRVETNLKVRENLGARLVENTVGQKKPPFSQGVSYPKIFLATSLKDGKKSEPSPGKRAQGFSFTGIEGDLKPKEKTREKTSRGET